MFLPPSATDKLRHTFTRSLIGKIKYNDPGVFRRLRVSDTSTLSNDEIRSFNAAHKDDIKLLKRLSRLVESPGFMTETYIYHKDWKDGDETVSLYDVEQPMQQALMRLLRGLTEFSETGTNLAPKRVFRPACRMPEDLVFLPTCTTQRAPDIECVPVAANESDVRNYSVRDFFVKVKPSSKKGPNVSQPNDIPDIVFESIEQASYTLNNRPFLLFCVGILIFGTKFCVGIFDRQGVVFSSVYDMFGRWDVFVRVVRSLTCGLSIQELGFDPTVRMLTEEETIALTGKKQDYPSSVITVSSIGQPPTEWCTIGRPMWTESSFLQGGTNIWRVKQCYISRNGERKTKWVLDDAEMILKTSWRNSMCNSESDIYHNMHTLLPNSCGIAKLECGGDVMFPESTVSITVHNLRDYPQCSDVISKTETTQVLQRLVISTVGDFLWNYHDELQLLRAFRDALLVHKALSEQGVLHREITPWNILLSHTPNDGLYAFLTGLNLARLPHENDSAGVSEYNVQGSVQFMAIELVESHWSAKEKVHHAVHHDIESFIWVLYFVVLHWLLNRVKDDVNPVHNVNVKAEESELEKILTDVFTQQDRYGILRERNFLAFLYPFVHSWEIENTVEALMSPQLIQLFDDLKYLLVDYYFAPSPVCLTYESVLEIYCCMLDPIYNFSSMSGERKFRRALNPSLIGNIRYNDPGDFRHLRISKLSLSDDEINSLNPAYKDDIRLLQRLSRLAESPGFMTGKDIYRKGWENGSQVFNLTSMKLRSRWMNHCLLAPIERNQYRILQRRN